MHHSEFENVKVNELNTIAFPFNGTAYTIDGLKHKLRPACMSVMQNQQCLIKRQRDNTHGIAFPLPMHCLSTQMLVAEIGRGTRGCVVMVMNDASLSSCSE